MEYMKKVWLSLGSVIVAGSLIMGGANRAATDDTQVNTYTTSNQRNPSVAMNINGDFVVTWESYGQSGGTTPMNDIYKQRFDSNGDFVGGEIPLWPASYDQKNPAVAMDDDGDIAIVYENMATGSLSIKSGAGRAIFLGITSSLRVAPSQRRTLQ